MTNNDPNGELASHIRDVTDFPTPGVAFKDLTPLLADPVAFGKTIDRLCEHFDGHAIDRVVGVEARGFIFAAPVAHRLGAGFVPVRKPGKLPWKVLRETYELEYGTDVLEVHRDAIRAGERVLLIDDVLATGGTAAATARLVDALGGELVACGFVVELTFLNGRSKLAGTDIHSLITFS